MSNDKSREAVPAESITPTMPPATSSFTHTPAQTHRYTMALGLIVVALSSVYPLLAATTYREHLGLYATNQIEGAAFGLVAAFVFIWRFRGLGDRFHLFVGLALMANAIHDLAAGCLAFANLSGWIMGPYSSLELFIPGTNIYGRLLMAVLLGLAPFTSRLFGKTQNPKSEVVWGVLAVTLLSGLGTISAYFIPLPDFLYPSGFSAASADLALTLLFVVALALFLRDYYHRREMMTWWVALCIAVNTVGQALGAFSRQPYDAFFSIGNLYEAISYTAPLLGLGLHHVAIAQERRRAELALRESETKYRLLVETMAEGLMVVDENGCITFANNRLCDLLGSSRPQLIGKPSLDFLNQDGQRILKEHLQRRKGERSSYEITWIAKDGRNVHTILSAVPILDRTGDFRGNYAVITDITDRKQVDQALWESNFHLHDALEELRRTQQKVVQQERLRALADMAAGVAHNFNDALTAVLGFSDLLLTRPESLQDPKKVTTYLEWIRKGAQEASKLVNLLREFHRRRDEAQVFLPTDLNQLIRQAISLTEPSWKNQALAKGASITINTDLQEIPPVPANEAELVETIASLIFNAVDAMPDGGEILIRSRLQDDHVVIEVSDAGVGMAEEVRQRCLEPFFTTKGGNRAGMGLALTHGVIERHSGKIEIESVLGKGTLLRLRLPLDRELKTEEVVRTKVDFLRPLRVLVADDEQPVRELVTAYLTGDGHSVETAANGLEALEKFRANDYDLVLLDKVMPGMTGEEVAHAIKEIAPDKPVILVSGFGETAKEPLQQPFGADLLISKPLTLAALRTALVKVAAP